MIEPNDWYRFGSKVFQFYITDEEIRDILLSSLPAQYEPYSLFHVTTKKVDQNYQEFLSESTILDFSELRKYGCWDFYIKSGILSDIENISSFTNKSIYLSLNGLINLQHGLINNQVGWCDSSIGIVNKIVNKDTNILIECPEYEIIFNKLKRSIKKRLCYKTKWKNKLGEVCDLPILMSDIFASKCKSGEIKTKIIIGDHL